MSQDTRQIPQDIDSVKCNSKVYMCPSNYSAIVILPNCIHIYGKLNVNKNMDLMES